MRFINLGAGPYFDVAIDQHTFTIIEADGVEITPITVDTFRIHPGQRYSAIVRQLHLVLVIRANYHYRQLNANQKVGNYCELSLRIFFHLPFNTYCRAPPESYSTLFPSRTGSATVSESSVEPS